MSIIALRSSASGKLSALHDPLTIVVMSLAVIAVYWPPPADADSVQLGLDYWQLHSRRMHFAREAIFGPAQMLPAWYPRELLAQLRRSDG